MRFIVCIMNSRSMYVALVIMIKDACLEHFTTMSILIAIMSLVWKQFHAQIFLDDR